MVQFSAGDGCTTTQLHVYESQCDTNTGGFIG